MYPVESLVYGELTVVKNTVRHLKKKISVPLMGFWGYNQLFYKIFLQL